MRTPQPGPPTTGKRRHRPRRARPATLTATLTTATAVAAALAGCSSQPPATTATSASGRPATVVTIPTAPATATTTPSTSGATAGYDVLANMPPAAKQHTNAGAQAFVRYYVEAMNSLLMNPAKDQLPKLFLPGCTECEKTEAILTNSVSARRRYSAPYFNIRAIGIPAVAGESVDASLHSRIHIGALVDTNAVQVTWADGPPTNKTPGNSFSLSMDLAWRDDRWFVVSFEDHDISSVEP